MLTSEIDASIEKSVLCWLATVSQNGMPNVSPKEVFTKLDMNHLIIANIASPKSVQNIKSHPSVCVSFIDVFVQKGFKITGTAQIIKPKDARYTEAENLLLEITQGKYPFASIIKVKVLEVQPIIAPSYSLYPEIDDEKRMADAKKAYGCA